MPTLLLGAESSTDPEAQTTANHCTLAAQALTRRCRSPLRDAWRLHHHVNHGYTSNIPNNTNEGDYETLSGTRFLQVVLPGFRVLGCRCVFISPATGSTRIVATTDRSPSTMRSTPLHHLNPHPKPEAPSLKLFQVSGWGGGASCLYWKSFSSDLEPFHTQPSLCRIACSERWVLWRSLYTSVCRLLSPGTPPSEGVNIKPKR